MKTSKMPTIVSSILIVAGIGLAPHSMQASSFTISEEIETGKVLGIHYYTLKEGVESSEFERFITEEWNPVNRELFPGILIRLMKGERGSEIGNYILIYEMNSLYIRNFYFPTAGEQTEAATTILEKCGEQCTQVWDRFEELAERSEYTDYVELLEK